jgi:hypothetical protein
VQAVAVELGLVREVEVGSRPANLKLAWQLAQARRIATRGASKDLKGGGESFAPGDELAAPRVCARSPEGAAAEKGCCETARQEKLA